MESSDNNSKVYRSPRVQRDVDYKAFIEECKYKAHHVISEDEEEVLDVTCCEPFLEIFAFLETGVVHVCIELSVGLNIAGF